VSQAGSLIIGGGGGGGRGGDVAQTGVGDVVGAVMDGLEASLGAILGIIGEG
jgi:hypothetical protein